MKVIKTSFASRLLLLLLCAALLVPQVSLAAKDSDPSRIRVLLQRLGLKDEAWMSLEGRYLARGDNGTEILLPVGSQVTVFLRKGQLVLFCEGLSFSAGKKLSLLRQEDGDTEPGIRFNLFSGVYAGDLTLSVADGAIRPILTLPLETYLLGVVPYEMSDSFPLEALKVQAVCARTYALSKLDPSEEWDVVDNTNDQVFRGTPAEAENTARAVQETEGLVLTSDGRLITAWYSASNGGQTELPGNIWGGDNIPSCFAMVDDPWDLQNSASTTRKAILNKDGSGLSAGFLRLLRASLKKLPELDDFRLEPEDEIRVDAVRAVELTTPRYKEPSRLMTQLKLTVKISAALKPGRTRIITDEDELSFEDEENPELTPEPVTGGDDRILIPAGTFSVTMDLFPDVVFMLSLSVYGANNEIITVTEDDKSFTLTSGRFGHGVGMSQRGAQQMASEGKKKYTEILDFYYPGAKLKHYEGEKAPLPTANPVLAETPGPVPTATPRPTLMPVTEKMPEGAWLAEVENIDDDSTLNLRELPSPGAKVIMRLYKHQKLIVLEEAEVTGWMKVKTDVIEGYVMASFLKNIP